MDLILHLLGRKGYGDMKLERGVCLNNRIWLWEWRRFHGIYQRVPPNLRIISYYFATVS